jgi:hypothetical protein
MRILIIYIENDTADEDYIDWAVYIGIVSFFSSFKCVKLLFKSSLINNVIENHIINFHEIINIINNTIKRVVQAKYIFLNRLS